MDLAAILPHVPQRRVEPLLDAVSVLEAGVAAGAVPNTEFVRSKEAINRAVWDVHDELQRTVFRGLDTLVMGAWNIPAALKEARKLEMCAAIDVLTAMLPLHELLQKAKPLIVKRMPGAASRKKTVGHMTCQLCGRLIGAAIGEIASHGYRRPGYGMQTRSCAGSWHLPYEVSRDRLSSMIAELRIRERDELQAIADVEAERIPVRLFVRDRSRAAGAYGSRDIVVVLTRTDAAEKLQQLPGDGRIPLVTFEAALAHDVARRESALWQVRQEIGWLEKRYDDWSQTHAWDDDRSVWSPTASSDVQSTG
jgi:hypothetical protein